MNKCISVNCYCFTPPLISRAGMRYFILSNEPWAARVMELPDSLVSWDIRHQGAGDRGD